MNKYKPLSFLLFLMLLGSTLLVFTPTVGASFTTAEDFEDDIVGQQAHDDYNSVEWFYSSQNTSGAYVDDTDAHGGTKSYRIADNHHTLFTMNITDIYNISFWTSRQTSAVGSWIHFVFTNATNHTIVEIRDTNDGTGKMGRWFKEWDNVWNRIGNDAENTEWVKFTINITAVDSVTYDFMTDTETGTPNHIGASMDEMAIKYVYIYLDSVAGACFIDLDDFTIRSGYEAPPEDETQTVYLNFFDLYTGHEILMAGNNFVGPLPGAYWGWATMEGTFTFPGYMNDQVWGTTLTLTGDFTNGEYYYINFTDITAFLGSGDNPVAYVNDENYLQMWGNQVYNIYFVEADPFDNIINGECRAIHSGSEPLEVCLYVDKKTYTAGEQTIFKYKLPTQAQLDKSAYLSGGWEIWVYNDDFRYNIFWETDGGDSASFVKTNLIYDNQYHTFTHTFPTPADGLDNYKVYIGQKGDWFDTFLKFERPIRFNIIRTGFTPNGNISSISPANPEVGQDVIITFNASNNGDLSYKLSTASQYSRITGFQKPAGNVQATAQFWEIGFYELKLAVSDGQDFQTVDTLNFWVNDTNGTAGGYGFNVEYLTIEPHFAVAGNDTIYISLKTLINNTFLEVIDARNQTTQFSTMYDAGAYTHKFKLPNHAPIGEWIVTLYCNNTLNSSFNVVAEENNYVEFTRNVFYAFNYKNKVQGQFQIRLRHDRPVILQFLKNGKAEGMDIYYDTNQQTNGVFSISPNVVTPTVGNWEVVLYESNDLIRKRVLSRDTCEVRQGAITQANIAEPGFENIFAMLATGAEIFGGGEYGLAFMALMITVVFMFVLTQGDKTGKNNDIVFMVGCGFFLFFAYIGWLPIWLVLLCILLTGLVFGEWISKKINLGG